MENLNNLFTLWLILLTVAQLAQWRGAVRFRAELAPYMRELDLKGELQRLQSTLNQRIVEQNADLVHRTRDLLARIKEDKHLHDKVWTQVQTLENSLK